MDPHNALFKVSRMQDVREERKVVMFALVVCRVVVAAIPPSNKGCVALRIVVSML